ncbi:MAG: nucleotidyl transferase AbiEii/AbiGii toxin family protein [Sphingomonas sp.]
MTISTLPRRALGKISDVAIVGAIAALGAVAAMAGADANRVEITVASIPALLAMKGHALVGRLKRKDAYDIYYCVRNYPGGPEALAEDCRPLLERSSAAKGYAKIASKFRDDEDYGPTCVREFVEGTGNLDDRTPAQWQTDAFGQVRAFLDALGL